MENFKHYFKVERLKAHYEKYERYLGGGALLVGFIIDSLTLRRVDLLLENLLLITYLLIAAICISMLNLMEARQVKDGLFFKTKLFFILGLQFALGGLFSAFLVFYSRSATVAASWPFLLVLIGYLIGSEVFKKHYIRLSFQVSTFFIALFSFFIFFIPVLLKNLSAWVFLLSGLISLSVIVLFIKLLVKINSKEVSESKKILWLSIGGIYLLINILYFTNIIPPIPLSLADVGVYHRVTRNEEGKYMVTKEKRNSLIPFLQSTETVHLAKGNRLFIYSAVFAPTKINASIVHRWQRYDKEDGEWKTQSRIPLQITGGRDGGYRTYSYKDNMEVGLWRVNIETNRGQIIGRKKFKVEFVSNAPELITEIK